MKKLLTLILVLALVGGLGAQNKKTNSKQLNWYNKDLKSDKVYGISTEKAYKELLKGKNPVPVVVAIIDGGTDINHEDLQGVIWTNKGEIAGNGIDDDHNGYIDDVHGWNFIGGKDGKSVKEDNLEITRQYRKLSAKYKDVDPKTMDGNADYKQFLDLKAKYLEKAEAAQKQYPKFCKIADKVHASDSIIVAFLHKKDYTAKDLKKIKSKDALILSSRDNLTYWVGMGVKADDLVGYKDQLKAEAEYQYNVDFDPRGIVGDNYEVNSSPYYGNNDVVGPTPSHGTFVAGNVGAVRGNKKGADGVANCVQMMIVRVVPDGDERDKDVANGILYAINNGAKVINMSFGKSYSPQKKFVDSVLRIANTKDVVLVHAAGNDAENNDVVTNYPENRDAQNQKLCNSWITVGASSMNAGKDLVAPFSNYGKQNVDVFAPGLDLNGLEPGNKYGNASGTSMASPVVAGLAAVIRGYFPELTAAEVCDIIIKSASKFSEDVKCPGQSEEAVMKNFSDLSVSGGVANLYNAVLMAQEMVAAKKK
ncbi:MAG: S8 family serine peptidase [Bacteroidota bacterium]